MNDFDKKLRQMAADDPVEVPDFVHQRIEDTLASLPAQEKKAAPVRKMPRFAAIAASFALVMLVALPNISPVYAHAVENIPVIGKIVRVVTIRNYLYSDDNHQMDVKVPHIADDEGMGAADRINQDVDSLTSELIKQFYNDVDSVGDQGHGAIYVNYDVLTNTDRWFTMKLSVHMLSGSGSSYFKYYNVDRTTGRIVNLGDLFCSDDFTECITNDIKAQMRLRTETDGEKVYWTGEDVSGIQFPEIGAEHNYYFNEDGKLVIPFDQYEVAPGSMGCPEFVISDDAIAHILKDEYKNIR